MLLNKCFHEVTPNESIRAGNEYMLSIQVHSLITLCTLIKLQIILFSNDCIFKSKFSEYSGDE